MRIGMPTIGWAKTRYTGSNAGDGLFDHSPAKTTQPSRCATPINPRPRTLWSLLMCCASLAMGLLVVVRVCFHQMWPWCWRRVVVVADDLAMACQAPTVGANVDH